MGTAGLGVGASSILCKEAKEGLVIEWSNDSDAKDGKRDDTD